MRYISLVNLLSNKLLVKELLQYNATPRLLAAEAMAMFQNPQLLDQMRKQLLNLRAQLGEPGVAARASQNILADLQKK